MPLTMAAASSSRKSQMGMLLRVGAVTGMVRISPPRPQNDTRAVSERAALFRQGHMNLRTPRDMRGQVERQAVVRGHGIEATVDGFGNLCGRTAEEGRAAGGLGELFHPVLISLIQPVGVLADVDDEDGRLLGGENGVELGDLL